MFEGITRGGRATSPCLAIFFQGHNEDVLLVFPVKGFQDKQGVYDLWFALLCVNLLYIIIYDEYLIMFSAS